MRKIKKAELNKIVDDRYTTLIACYGLRNVDKITKMIRRKVINEIKRRKVH